MRKHFSECNLNCNCAGIFSGFVRFLLVVVWKLERKNHSKFVQMQIVECAVVLCAFKKKKRRFTNKLDCILVFFFVFFFG